MSQHIGPRTISAQGGSIKRVGNYRVHTFPSELVTDGLVLNLDAGDPRSYPSSGTTWTDLSGNGNNGTLVNGPTYSNADGGSLAFTKSSLHYVTSSTSTVRTHGSNPFTLEAWARNTITGDYNTVLSTHGSSRQIGFHQGSFMWGGNGGGGNTLIYSGSRNLNQWYHLVMTFDGLGGNIGKLYVDGVLLATGNIGDNGATSTSIVRVGSYATAGTEFLDGNVSIARVYNRALSAAEVAQNYDALRVRYGAYTNTFTPICAGGEGKVEVLCVAGGGGGGHGTSGGGGGAGGLLYNSAFTINSNTGIGVTVGGGGTGTKTDSVQATNGGNSVFGSLTSVGGGYGGNENASVGPRNGNSGGSGGGGSFHGNGGSGTVGQGNAGGTGISGSNRWTGGGGGGAGSSGASASSYYAGDGGSGLAYSISGTSSYYAGGGGGAAQSYGGAGTVYGGNGGNGGGGTGPADQTGSQVLPGVSGIPNTGGGGSGGVDSVNASSGNGANGVVIVRYPATDYNVEVLVVGGGGGGGQDTGGGGGAGGLIYNSSYSVSSGKKLQVTVGKGGPRAAGNSLNATSGNNSVFSDQVAFGGGYGSSNTSLSPGGNGGSGGGGGAYSQYQGVGGTGVSGQGNNGGDAVAGAGGGGGGAGQSGFSGDGTTNGDSASDGGDGLTYSITGSSVVYAAGGGGGQNTSDNRGTGGSSGVGGDGGTSTRNPTDPDVNTGSGGGGGSSTDQPNGNRRGTSGADGIVIIAYKGPQRGIGGTIDTTSRPGYTLHKFTTTGTDFFIP